MNKIISIVLASSVLAGCAVVQQRSENFTLDQRLIIAAHHLDTAEVRQLLATGANVNARFGKGDSSVFKDKWDLGWPMASPKWTPLLAVMNSPTYPEPEHETENTTAALEEARERMRRIPASVIQDRDARRIVIAKTLLDAGADVDADDGYGATPLYEAASRRYEDIAFAILSHNPTVNTRTGIYIDPPGGYTPLHEALDSPRLLKELIARGANLNAQASWGDTPLTQALSTGNTNAAAMLLAAGAVIPKEGHAASSLFHDAVFLASDTNGGVTKAIATFRLLIEAGADPNGKSETFDGATALPLAVSQIDEPAPFVRMLIAAGANVNVRDHEGRTPLHLTAMFRRLAAAKLLVSAGADATATNSEGKTPFQVAEWVLDEVETPEMDDYERQMLREGRAIAGFLRHTEQQQRGANKVPEDTARQLADPQH
jgi:ankyrin repeat protein